MAKIRSELIHIAIGGTVVVCGTSNSWSRSVNAIDTTCQDAGGDQSNIAGLASGSCSMEIHTSDADSDFTIDDIEALMEAKAPVTIRRGPLAVGSKYREVDAIITGVEISGGEVEGVESASIEFTHTGSVTYAAVV